MPLSTITHDSPLGSWKHVEWRASDNVAPVESMWHFEGRMALLRERQFPRPFTEIILQLGPRFRNVAPSGASGDVFPESCIAGATTRPFVIEAPESVCCVIGIQLQATAAHALLGYSPAALRDRTVDLNDALGTDASFLAERCSDAPDVESRFAVIREFLTQRFARAERPGDGVAWAASELRRTMGRAAIASLQEQSAYSRTRFISQFREQTGFAPKQYARILRFRHSLRLLQGGSRLSDAALSAGYYDQSHMQNEFAAFTGMTPASFVAATRFPNSMSLPESAE
ncbi:MAG: helix-turn-helix domain-containing protein [Gemmatimonas sp.]